MNLSTMLFIHDLAKWVVLFTLHEHFAVKATQCGEHLQMEHGTLASPNYPHHYPNNLDCWWSISVPSKYREVHLSFRKFNVENPRWAMICFRDYVDIFQVVDGKRQLTGRFCGKKGSFNVTSFSNRVDIRLKTNRYRSKRGFSLDWIALQGCGEVQEGLHGEIRSQSFANLNSKFCKWDIKAPKATQSITLKILKLKLGKNLNDCRRQFISIEDATGSKVAKYCQNTPSTILHIHGNQLTISTKCKDPGSLVFDADWQANQDEVEDQCGMPLVRRRGHRQRRLVGASMIDSGSWPWMARVRSLVIFGRFKLKEIICGGAIISKRFVLTAAHCVVFDDHVYQQDVMFGAESVFDRSAVYVKVKRILVHPDFKGGIKNDIALLELEHDVPVNQKIRRICLPFADTKTEPLRLWESKACWVGGWGRSALYEPNSDFVQHLPVKLWIDCLRSSLHFCGLYYSKKQGTCLGDSGSPLVCQNSQGQYYLIGVLSHGPSACLSQFDTYTNVGSYTPWINQVLANATQFEGSTDQNA